MGTFSIRVVDENGKPQEGVTVYVDFGIWNGGTKEYTDEDGWAFFDNNESNFVTAEFFVAHSSVGEHSTRSGETYSYTI